MSFNAVNLESSYAFSDDTWQRRLNSQGQGCAAVTSTQPFDANATLIHTNIEDPFTAAIVVSGVLACSIIVAFVIKGRCSRRAASSLFRFCASVAA